MKLTVTWLRPGAALKLHAYADSPHVAATVSLCQSWRRLDRSPHWPTTEAGQRCRECASLVQGLTARARR